MPFLKNFTAPNGAALTFHRVSTVEIRPNGLAYTIQSWPTEQDYLSGKPALWNTYKSAEVPVGFLESLETLALSEDEFLGGSSTPDNADTLETLKEKRWAYIKQQREAHLDDALTTPYGVFDSDRLARQNITNAAQLASTMMGLGESGTIDFTLANNTSVSLTYMQMVEVALMLGAKIQTVFSIGRLRRAQIDAATTPEEVEAVVW